MVQIRPSVQANKPLIFFTAILENGELGHPLALGALPRGAPSVRKGLFGLTLGKTCLGKPGLAVLVTVPTVPDQSKSPSFGKRNSSKPVSNSVETQDTVAE
jgi:hypothetical protein